MTRTLTATIAFTLSALLALGALSSTVRADPWDKSINAAAGSRFIPVQLWTGAPWNGSFEITMTDADLTFGDGRKRISGPVDWTAPVSGNQIKIYERTHTTQNKKQLFAVNHDGAALGRVYDSRYQTSIVGGAKFPLGTWREFEKRAFLAKYAKPNGKSYLRRMTIEILKLDFEAHGIKHCLKFRWTTAKPGKNKQRDDNNYTYCPGKGLVELEDN
ncbi:MAG: hypothetical protein HOF27_11755 [Rhodospirillaceae bacterium]|nr:hypothetical protein [Rhodospirillaceae bacterium]